MLKRSLLFFSLFCFLMPLSSFTQSALNQKLDLLYKAYADQPGAMVGIWKEGTLLFAESYGLANLEHKVPFTTHTTSDMGSLAKQFTCYAILLLEQQGKLSVEDDIRKYLSYVPDFGETITIRHLMNHTSGIREIYNTESIRGGRGGDAIFQEDILRLMRQQKELNFSPGTEFMYCNTSYAMLAEIVEQVGAMPFERWMFSHIFEPLGMNQTYIMDLQGEVFPNMAASYYLQSDSVYTKVFDNSTIRGQGGMYSCLEDMMKWMKNVATKDLGGSIIMEKMTERTILNSGDTISYAKGLYVDRFRGLNRIFHTGSSAGYRSILVYLPDHDLGVFVNTNAPNVPRYEAVDIVIEHFLRDFIKDETTSSEVEDVTVKEEFPPVVIDKDYAGWYYSPELEVRYQLLVENGQLKGRHFRHGEFVLEGKAKDEFTSQRSFFPHIVFERNPKGKVMGLRVSASRAKNIQFLKQ